MSYQFPADVAQLVKSQMASGGFATEDDLLRDALYALDEKAHEVVEEDPVVIDSVRRGLDQVSAGQGRSFEEFDAQFRATHGIP